jgi:hypothetical protein
MATGDDVVDGKSVGTAGAYEVRYATAPLTTDNFAQGTLVAAFPPGPAGSAQELAVSGLISNTAYYFAIVVVDDGGNRSGLSNVAAGRTALRRGYNLVSVPLVLAAPNNTADMVFGDDVGLPVYAYRWQSSGSSSTDGCYLGTISIPGFTVCGPLGPIQTGAGYFLYSSGTQAVLDALGVPVPDSPYNVPLGLGFNMVGNPYGQEIPLASVQVKCGSAGVHVPVPYADAVAKCVGPAIYVYEGATTLTYGVTEAVLKPWNGVWVESLVSDAVLVFAHQPTIGSLTPATVTYGVTNSQSVAISGTHFVLGATIEITSLTGTTVAGTTATEPATAAKPYVYSSSGTLRFWWPNTALLPGAYTVTVTNPAAAGGLTASQIGGFTVVAPP